MAATRKKRRKKNSFVYKRRRLFHVGDYFEYSLLFVVILLVIIGLVMLYSTSSYKAGMSEATGYDAAYYLKKQFKFALLGFAGMVGISFIDYHKWQSYAKIMMAGIIGVLMVVLIIGKASHGATRWLSVGGATFQPSEFAKFIVIIYAACIVNKRSARLGDVELMVKSALMPIVAVGLIAFQNLSTAILCACIVIAIFFITAPKIKPFIIMGACLGALVIIFLFTASYRMTRVKMFFHPEDYPDDSFQVMQGLYAIGSGGFFGKGLGQSIQKLEFLPEAHNDYIFSIICEELGFFGAACIILLFVILLWKCVVIAFSAPDLLGSLIVIGVATHISLQTIVNIAVVTRSIPATGVPLPFISYGGSAIITNLAEMGLVFAVARHIKLAKQEETEENEQAG